LYLACKKKKVPWYVKAIAAVVVAYALSPVDLIPDFILGLGWFKQIKWKPVLMFILGAAPMSILGAFSFVKVPKEIITLV
jgi:hypothetical protein